VANCITLLDRDSWEVVLEEGGF